MHRDDQNRSAEFIPLPSSKVTAVPPHRMGRGAFFRCRTVADRPRCNKLKICATVAFAISAFLFRTFACGPFFPNTLLDRGDEAVLTAPEARFRLELDRMRLIASSFRALPATNYPRQTLDAELTDLRAALEKSGAPSARRHAIVEQHRLEREKILVFAAAQNNGDQSGTSLSVREGFVLRPDPTNAVRIPSSMPKVTPGLPNEFADYFRGSVAWHLGKMDEARAGWKALLARPAAERHFKSTWAAFMLGKSWENEHRDRAIGYFRDVRALVKAGFADTLGLAASSLGWEARLHLQTKDFASAVDLYLEQAASGEPSAIISLRWAAAAALRSSEPKLRDLALHTRAQRVITAYVISGGWRDAPMDVDNPIREGVIRAWEEASARMPLVPKPKSALHEFKEPALRWLEAAEAAGVVEAESVEQLALAAYQGGQMDRAARWLKLARTTPVAQWLRAKLFLRDGKVDEAARLMAQLVQLFPLDSAVTNRPALSGLAGSLYVANGIELEPISVTAQLHGEWGVFRLARRQYSEALEALLRSGFWEDAAYVAERVLTLDELKRYVDRHWPTTTRSAPTANEREKLEDADVDLAQEPGPAFAERIRDLLARRLARAERRNEARGYFRPEALPQFDALCAALGAARNAGATQTSRARAFFEAAKITREHGLDLIGAEVEPDWGVHGGNYQTGVSLTNRVSLQSSNVLAATTDEITRATQQSVQPNERFHYRYQAAALAWEAAKLMPNNSDETARVLCVAGSWIKDRNPKAADVFYKALVRRCRKTAIGAEADRIRWFPSLDSDGNLRSRSRPQD